jgi:hypothetical protein
MQGLPSLNKEIHMGSYGKFVAALAATVLTAIAAATTDGTLTLAEQINVVIVLLGAISVAGAGNLPAGVWAYAKTYVAAASAISVVIASALSDGISVAEWIQAAIAGLGAVGVYALPGPTVSPSTGRHQAL